MVKLNKKKIIIITIPVVLVAVIVFIVINIILNSRIELVNTGKTYEHNTESYTQGLFFDDEGNLYETGGDYGVSALYAKIDLPSGMIKKTIKADPSVFFEGATFYKGKIYVLTLEEYKAYRYNKDLTLDAEMKYIRKGWGLTTDGKHLIASDGSSNLYFMDENFKTIKTVRVFDENDRPVRYLNELEYINGFIFANIWRTNNVVVINPDSGKIIKTYDFTDLYPLKERTGDVDVMNGIAYDKKNNKVYLTGKYWPKYYEFELK